MSPFRWPVLITGFVLAIPVLALGMRGDLSSDEVAVRLLWCLAAGWVAVLLVQWASAPQRPVPRPPGPSDEVPAPPSAADEELTG